MLALGWLYFQVSGGTDALAAIGLISFAGLAQLSPALLAGIFWQGATRHGAIAGLVSGSLVWGYTLLLPSFGGNFFLSASTIENGLFGVASLRPEALFGVSGMDPLVHAFFWSLSINAVALVTVSLFTRPNELERLQTALFVDVFKRGEGAAAMSLGRSATSEDLFTLAQRILGGEEAYRLFAQETARQGLESGLCRVYRLCLCPRDDYADCRWWQCFGG